MKSRTFIPALLACCGLGLSGFDTLTGGELTIFNNPTVSAEGVRPLIENDEFENIDMVSLLSSGDMAAGSEKPPKEQRKELDKAFGKFYGDSNKSA